MTSLYLSILIAGLAWIGHCAHFQVEEAPVVDQYGSINAIRALYNQANRTNSTKDYFPEITGAAKVCLNKTIKSYASLLRSSPTCMKMAASLPHSNKDLNGTEVFDTMCTDGACATLFFRYVVVIQRCGTRDDITHQMLGQEDFVNMVLDNPEMACQISPDKGVACIRQMFSLSDLNEASCPIINDCVIPFTSLIEQYPSVNEGLPWDSVCAVCPHLSLQIKQCHNITTAPPPTKKPILTKSSPSTKTPILTKSLPSTHK